MARDEEGKALAAAKAEELSAKLAQIGQEQGALVAAKAAEVKELQERVKELEGKAAATAGLEAEAAHLRAQVCAVFKCFAVSTSPHCACMRGCYGDALVTFCSCALVCTLFLILSESAFALIPYLFPFKFP